MDGASKNDEGKPIAMYFYLHPATVAYVLQRADNTGVGEYKYLVAASKKLEQFIESDLEDTSHFVEFYKLIVDYLKEKESIYVIINGVSKASKVGADKHGMFNYTKGFSMDRLVNALCRHLAAHILGEERDQESHETHMHHVLANCYMIFYQMEYRK